MFKLKKLIGCFSAAVLMAVGTGEICPVHASDGAGSIGTVMKYETAEDGTLNLTGTVVLYKVKDKDEYTDDFKNCPAEGTDAEVAQAYGDYAEEHDILPFAEATIEDGYALFDNLEEGTYLVAQKTASKGFSRIKPVLVALPTAIDEYYSTMKVVTQPKVEKVETHSLTVKKLVKGNTGNRAKKFGFKIKSAALAGTEQSLEDGTKLKFDESGTASFSLSDGESIVFPTLTDGISIEVVEDDYSKDGYITTYDNQKIDSFIEDKTVVVTNTRFSPLPTGSGMQIMAEFAGFGVLCGLCIYEVMKHRKGR